jgi:hypothetical protein
VEAYAELALHDAHSTDPKARGIRNSECVGVRSQLASRAQCVLVSVEGVQGERAWAGRTGGRQEQATGAG